MTEPVFYADPMRLLIASAAGIIWGKIIGNKIYTKLPANIEGLEDTDDRSSGSNVHAGNKDGI